MICRHHPSSGWFCLPQSHPCVGSPRTITHIVRWMTCSKDKCNFIILLSKDLPELPSGKRASLSYFNQEGFTGLDASYCLSLTPRSSVPWMYQVCATLGLCSRIFLIFGLPTPSVFVRTLQWNRILTIKSTFWRLMMGLPRKRKARSPRVCLLKPGEAGQLVVCLDPTPKTLKQESSLVYLVYRQEKIRWCSSNSKAETESEILPSSAFVPCRLSAESMVPTCPGEGHPLYPAYWFQVNLMCKHSQRCTQK